jgi:effector-binding domain-containing protein
MKKTVLLIAIPVILIIGFFPYNTHTAIRVKASYQNCYQQLMEPVNWVKWQPGATGPDTSGYKLIAQQNQIKLIIPQGYFLIKRYDSNTLLLKKENDNSSFDYTLSITAGQLGVLTDIVIGYKTNLFKSIWPGYETGIVEKTGINNFKNFMESVKLYYGFDIKRSIIAEQKIIVKRKTVLKADIYKEAYAMQREITNYVAQKKLTITGPVMAQYNTKYADSVEVLIGLPISEKTETGNGYIYMTIPATKVLIAAYKGKDGDKQKIYSAMGNYLQDNFLHPKIAPMEVFTNKLPATENDTVSFKLSYPIF